MGTVKLGSQVFEIKRIKAGKEMFNIKVTPYFYFDEWACKKCLKEGVYYNVVTSMHVWKVNLLREAVGVPLIVISGSRCPKHNKEVGGHDKSLHAFGPTGAPECEASDVYSPYISYKEIYLKCEQLNHIGGLGVYPYYKIPIVHLDSRDKLRYRMEPKRWIRIKDGTYVYLV